MLQPTWTQQHARVRVRDAEVVQQKKGATPQYSARQLQHAQEKELKHFSAAKHAESRRYLLPGEDYAKDMLELAEHNLTSQTQRTQPQPQTEDGSPHEKRIRAGLYEPAPMQAINRQRQFKNVGGVWVPIE